MQLKHWLTLTIVAMVWIAHFAAPSPLFRSPVAELPTDDGDPILELEGLPPHDFYEIYLITIEGFYFPPSCGTSDDPDDAPSAILYDRHGQPADPERTYAYYGTLTESGERLGKVYADSGALGLRVAELGTDRAGLEIEVRTASGLNPLYAATLDPWSAASVSAMMLLLALLPSREDDDAHFDD